MGRIETYVAGGAGGWETGDWICSRCRRVWPFVGWSPVNWLRSRFHRCDVPRG